MKIARQRRLASLNYPYTLEVCNYKRIEKTKDNREKVDSRTMSNLIDSLVRFHQDDMGSPKKGF